MAQRFVLPVLATMALTVLFASPARPVTGDAAKPGAIVTVAGTGTPGFSGDNGPAPQAELNSPEGLAFDAAGNLYIADAHNARVRKVSPDGPITTVAGTGKPGFSGDGGKATDAQLNNPGSMAVNAAGNLFIGDLVNHRVRKVTPDGIITTYAGSGPVDDSTTFPRHGGFSGDNGPATDARLNGPGAPAVDAHGNLFIVDGNNYRVRKVDAVTGVITTVAGSGRKKYAGDGGLATQTGLRGPRRLAIDAVGNLLIADSGYYHEGDGLPFNERVLKVFGVAAPGLLAGMAFPTPKQP